MVPSKRSPKRAPREKGSVKITRSDEISGLRRWLSRKDGAPDGRLEIRDYVVMNAIFASVCLVQLIIVRILLRDFVGLYFFFGFLICAFFVASVFDYFSEKLNMGASAGEDTELTND